MFFSVPIKIEINTVAREYRPGSDGLNEAVDNVRQSESDCPPLFAGQMHKQMRGSPYGSPADLHYCRGHYYDPRSV